MDNTGGTGITTAIILVSFILIGATATSLIMGNSEKIPERNFKEMVDEIVDEISNYIQIKDIMGRYYSTDSDQIIKKIAILIKPLFSFDIDVSELMIKIDNGEQIKILYYSGQAGFIYYHSLFEHPIWNNMKDNTFGFVVILDKDKSIVDNNAINDNTDTAYIAIKLPKELAMKKGDTMKITLFPSTGISRTIVVEAPIPMKQIVSLN